MKSHASDPESIGRTSRRRNGEQADLRSVACIGDSLVRGQVSVSFVDMLRQRLGGEGFHFSNAGINGDLAYNVLRRLDGVIAQQPDFVIVLVGGNDVNATLSPTIGLAYRLWKSLPQAPSIDWYGTNMLQLLRLLKEKTSARIAVTSLTILGEDLGSLPNERMRKYSDLLKDIAIAEGVAYLPVHERMEEHLQRNHHAPGRAHDANSKLMWTSLFRHYVLRRDFEAIARENGFILTTEGLHLNRAGAGIVADVIEAFLRSSA